MRRSAHSPHRRSARPATYPCRSGDRRIPGGASGAPDSAATSRAIPSTLRQSPRFGVRLSPSTTSSRPRVSASVCPAGSSAGSSSRPDASSDKPSSRAEQSMPKDSSPRRRALRISSPPGSVAPTEAKGAFIPARTLGPRRLPAPSHGLSRPGRPSEYRHSGGARPRSPRRRSRLQWRTRGRDRFNFEPGHRQPRRELPGIFARARRSAPPSSHFPGPGFHQPR